MRPSTTVVSALGAALLVAGCSIGGGEPDPVTTVADATQDAAVQTADPSEGEPTGTTGDPTGNGTTGDGPSADGDDATADATAGADATTGTATGGSAEPSESTSTPVDLTAQELLDRHPNGSTLQVTSVAVQRTGIVVGVTVVNGYTDEIQLNSRGLYLQDDVGNGYNFRAPAQNEGLAVAPGAELVGDLVFVGVLDPAATSLTLKTNVYDAEESIDLSSRNDRSTAPAMQVAGIPVD